ncbi:hypothetical protein [Georgenia sp. SYP-B2076]|uniref:hypothetical protein n=1 Tax=Georgenia sp. SYP-B2076 TaxID=2495881 RepID=UPI000F8F3E30|nr:hypothetical protein [Georgenia sp. SYP-B2076]
MPTNTAIALDRPYLPDPGMGGRRISAYAIVRHLLELPSQVSVAHRRHMLTIALWKWTEATGVSPYSKYHIRYRSRAAMEVWRTADVHHEHVWPRAWLIDQLLARTAWSEGDLWAFLDTYGVGCVVTVEEHGRLGDGRGWDRYTEAGIEVVDVLSEEPAHAPGAPFKSPWPRAEAGPVTQTLQPRIADTHPIPSMTEPAAASVRELIDQHARPIAALLRELIDRYDGEEVVFLPGKRRDGTPTDYLRVHDLTVDGQSSAIAYVHWSGKVSVRLAGPQIPGHLRDIATLSAHARFGVECRIRDRQTIDVAEGLIDAALEVGRTLEPV